jgi:hypothetical protein
LRTVRQLWGVEPETWERTLPLFKQQGIVSWNFSLLRKIGYFAVETCVANFSPEDQKKLMDLLEQNDLKLVYQIHTDPYRDRIRVKNVDVSTNHVTCICYL